jgi:hypothetical protein
MTAPAGKEKLAEAIAHRLDPTATAITKEHICEQCEECEEDFKVCFDAGVIDEKEQPVWIDVKDQRARLRAIEKTLAAGARAIWQEPQEIDWRPNPAALLARFIDRFVEQSGDREIADKFKAAVAWFDLLSINSTELSTLLHAWSRLAGGKAQQLTPNARSIPIEDFFAHWGWRLVHEFSPGLAPEVLRDPQSEEARSSPEQRTVAGYITANWPRLSPKFRTAHNRLLQARGLPEIPEPEIDEFIPPTPVQRRRFPWKKYLTVTGLLAEYVRGSSDMKFRDACLKVRRRYQG